MARLNISLTSKNFSRFSPVNSNTTPQDPVLTGGVRYSDSTYYYQTFTSSDTLQISGGSVTGDFLIIGSGGSDYNYDGQTTGGAGAGGVLYVPNVTLNPQTLPILVGAGGKGQGNNSSADIYTAWGGAVSTPYAVGVASGGSGAGGTPSHPGSWYGGQPIDPAQGNSGGNGWISNYCYTCGYGGGGGAGEVGQNAVMQGYGDHYSGRGGNGTSTYTSWAEATSTGVLEYDELKYYAGGAGGGSWFGGPFNGAGGLGGGQYGRSGMDSPANTGGAASIGNGGSGLVIFRYPKEFAILGGIATEDSNYNYRTFLSSDTLTVINGSTDNAEILLIGGGGNQSNGNSNSGGGGGGAGGVIVQSSVSLTPGTYPVVVGSAGGNSSIFNNIEAVGGGGGQTWYFDAAGNGGSGGGGDWNSPGGTGIPGQGYDGGSGYRFYATIIGGGGGGANGPGASAGNGSSGGAGIELLEWANATSTGVNGYYAGGGGGGLSNGGTSGYGIGGGGGANTGSGGTSRVHGPGSGLFIIRWPK
jgi:hypothetical protein